MAGDQDSKVIKAIDALTQVVMKQSNTPVFGVPGKEALAYAMVFTQTALAMSAAQHGDWDGAAKALLNMSNSAAIIASGGSLLIAESVYDAIAAVANRAGYDAPPSFSDWLQAAMKNAGEGLGDIAYGTLHPGEFPTTPPGDYHFPEPGDAGVPGGVPDQGDNRPTDIEVDVDNTWRDNRTGETGGPVQAGLPYGPPYDPGNDAWVELPTPTAEGLDGLIAAGLVQEAGLLHGAGARDPSDHAGDGSHDQPQAGAPYDPADAGAATDQSHHAGDGSHDQPHGGVPYDPADAGAATDQSHHAGDGSHDQHHDGAPYDPADAGAATDQSHHAGDGSYDQHQAGAEYPAHHDAGLDPDAQVHHG
jgi:hypothetical protein